MGLVWIFITIGGIIGSYIPVLFGADGLSLWSLIGGTVGSLLGIWAYAKMDL